MYIRSHFKNEVISIGCKRKEVDEIIKRYQKDGWEYTYNVCEFGNTDGDSDEDDFYLEFQKLTDFLNE